MPGVYGSGDGPETSSARAGPPFAAALRVRPLLNPDAEPARPIDHDAGRELVID